MLQLPRSVRLAAWGTAALRGETTPAQAAQLVCTDDEPHGVQDDALLLLGRRAAASDPVPGPGVRHTADSSAALEPAGSGLVSALGALRTRGVTGLRVVLPAPGDLLGLPGPPAFNLAAVQAGEAVLAEPGDDHGPTSNAAAVGLVPQVTAFGSAWEPGATVVWQVHEVAPRRVGDQGSLAEAERELREALREATATLADLDVARWRPDAAERIAMLRDGGLPAGTLPPTAPPRSVAVLATAARVQAIVELARQDDGGSVTGLDATRRAGALRALEQVSRRAVAAAVNGMLEPR